MNDVVFVDTEVSVKTKKVQDYGAIKINNLKYHGNSGNEFKEFIKNSYFIVGHNIVQHDIKYINPELLPHDYSLIDTLTISPLIYPKKEYHHLLKDDKLFDEANNNPLNDSIKCRDLFILEVAAFKKLDDKLKNIYGTLLQAFNQFKGFFEYVKYRRCWNVVKDISKYFEDEICYESNTKLLVEQYPIELAYALAIITLGEKHEIVAPWVQINYPKIDFVMKHLRGIKCNNKKCKYCNKNLDIKAKLKQIFNYDDFRLYDGENLQEKATQAAVDGKSILAVFPTGGGKSITFQLPALMAGENLKGLTIVISPLQSLMKDQVDGLTKKGIIDAVTINGLLSPVERQKAIELVMNGTASILYLSPELLRSKTLEKMLMARNVVRVVIDEAHCFSSWGQDFRVDYLYIGDFIKELKEKKADGRKIPVSCFTATAKQKVIADICDYFKEKLGIYLDTFATTAARENLHYKVELKETDEEKYSSLRELILNKNKDTICPTIVYVSRVKETEVLAERLTKDGIKSLPYNGKMERELKIKNQDSFIKNEVNVMIATSAFGMGVDKPDVKLVVHYDISDSLENYVQEAGRAGRDQHLNAECIVYFNEKDLDKHFSLLNETKLNMAEVSQIWKAIKSKTNKRNSIYISPLELARAAGWDADKNDSETRVKTAVAALEAAKYISRGLNSPRVYATSLQVKGTAEGRPLMEKSGLFSEEQTTQAIRILTSLISSKYTYKTKNADAESRVDYLADNLGMTRGEVITLVDKMRQAKILADADDMTAFLKDTDQTKLEQQFSVFAKLEEFLIGRLKKQENINLKDLNEQAQINNCKKSSVMNIKTILLFWTVQGYIKKSLTHNENFFMFEPIFDLGELKSKIDLRRDIIFETIRFFFTKKKDDSGAVSFSMLELLDNYNHSNNLFERKCTYKDIQDALYFISRISLLNIEGGFLVLYNAMQINRVITDNKIQYKKDDYKQLEEFYKMKIQQIHIVGEYAAMMVKDYNQALTFVKDYFSMEFEGFIKKYFKGDRKGQIKLNITPEKYNKIFSSLSEEQKAIIDDNESKSITTIAGPGSGKTLVLVRKLASLLMIENVKTEQLLMLTFSREAATEFKKRLIKILGGSAHYVDIKTFHSYCFDLIGKNGNEESFDSVVKTATQMIEDGEVEACKISKTCLVIDEGQDMDENEFKLIKALSGRNPDMRIIAVGDDDQNIYEFRGSDSKYLKEIMSITDKPKQYELLTNYRSSINVVAFANHFAKRIKSRLKTNPIKAHRLDQGKVEIVRHYSNNIEEAIVNHLSRNIRNNQSNAILTWTNEEASKVLALLETKGIRAKMIQSYDNLNLYNMAEIRTFLHLIDKNIGDSPIIENNLWNATVNRLKEIYNNTLNYAFLMNVFNTFSEVNQYKYKTDLLEFLKESKYEDFIDINNEKVVVSTIHKSKGHEFDNVYMLLNKANIKSDKDFRVYYVGMTRAKNNLIIHLNDDMLDNYKNTMIYTIDNKIYSDPSKITLQLTLSDVGLYDFKTQEKKNQVIHALPGDKINAYENEMCLITKYGKFYYKYSRKFSERLSAFLQKDYVIENAFINMVVAWYDKEDINKTEYAIFLPTINLIRKDKFEAIQQSNNTLASELKDTLKQYRLLKSKELSILPYLIFSNQQLDDLINKNPSSKEELLNVNGFGKKKTEQYGDEIIAIFNKKR